MKKEVSLETVARRAGVAKSTVSFVINKKANVAPQTREKVWTALRELGYVKDGLPVSTSQDQNSNKELKPKKNVLIYVNPSLWEKEVAVSYMNGLREYAAIADKLAFSYAMSSSEIESNVQLAFLEQATQPQAILMIGIGSDHPFVQQALQTGKPCLIVNRINNHPDLSYVSINHRQAGRDAAQYLLGLGHRHFLLLVQNSYNETEIMRVEGFLEALAAQSGVAMALVDRFRASTPPEEFRAGPKEFLRSGKLLLNDVTQLDIPDKLEVVRSLPELKEDFNPTCLVAANDYLAYQTQTGLQTAGLEIPRALSIMSLNSSSLSTKANPQITAIDESWHELGKMAGRILDDLTGNPLLWSQKVILRHRLVERSSTARPEATS